MDTPHADSNGWEVFLTDRQKYLLKRGAIGTSGTSIKGAHILDPRTGKPNSRFYRTWALHPSAATADALSTAWMLLDSDEIEEVCCRLPGSQAILQQNMTDEQSLHFIGTVASPSSTNKPESSHGANP